MTDDKLLQRIAQTLKQEIGPAIDVEYPKTQAFMAGVVLQKLGAQLGLASQHQAAERAELDALIADLSGTLGAAPSAIRGALEVLARDRDKAAICALIETLYANRAALGDERFTAALSRVRRMLRASVDRQMEYAA